MAYYRENSDAILVHAVELSAMSSLRKLLKEPDLMHRFLYPTSMTSNP
jgi:hypothetical protein